ncbi:AAA family ATPase [Helicobacter heilmannii]|uniref:AAA family ATPase n=1 Tax=Helicobacter heilmannii TaxID=35817 RepID=UPI0006A1A892|nr:AAA family ATPase [Helicobacter heilmannii]CRF45788.1 hypothetical protein HHE014_07650 [Helicobacter heilmannii]
MHYILIWLCVEVGLFLAIVAFHVVFAILKAIFLTIATKKPKPQPKSTDGKITLQDLEESKKGDLSDVKQESQDIEVDTQTTKTDIENTTPPKQEKAMSKAPTKETPMLEASKNMGIYDLKRFLLLQGRDDLAQWTPKQAYHNFGWLVLDGLFQYDRFAWEQIANQVFCHKEQSQTHYFFAGIHAQRRNDCSRFGFYGMYEISHFLVGLCTPFASYDPYYLECQRALKKDLEGLEEEERVELLQGEHPEDYAAHQALEKWKYHFKNMLISRLERAATHFQIHEQVFSIFPPCIAQALETHREGNFYRFQITDTSLETIQFDPEILRAHLLKSLKSFQEHLEECAQNLAPPLKNLLLTHEIRQQLAKLCLAQHCGLITPEYTKHFKLHDPEDSEAIQAVAKQFIEENLPSFKDKIKISEENAYFALRRFFVEGQKHYYMEQALWVWVYQRLLEIFNGSLETRQVRAQLLVRLSPEQAQEFTQAFSKNIEEKQNTALWCLICHLSFPLALFQHEKQLIIAKNPAFNPAVFLRESAHNNDILRILFFFGRVLKEEDISDLLQTNSDHIPAYTPKGSTEAKPTENKATITGKTRELEIHAYKGVYMDRFKTPMDFYDLRAYLIKHKAGCLSWIAEKAYQNFGWVVLDHFHQAQGAHIAWRDITDDQIYKGKEVHYFFAGICAQRQAAQNPISFKDKTEVFIFLVELFKPYALQDPNHVYHLKKAHDNLQSVDIPTKRFGRRLYLEIVKIWGIEFTTTLEKILQSQADLFGNPMCVKLPLKDLPFLPKEAALALEKYRQGDAYIFKETYKNSKDLPPFNRQILRSALTGSLKSWQGSLAGVADRLVRPEREPTLKRKARKQLAKICLKKFYGVLPLERFAEFKLDTPLKNSSLEAYSFMCQGQKHYYIDSALWLWTAARLLQIFNGSIESRGIEEELLSRLSPKQAEDFTLAFGNDPIKCLKGSVSWDLISHLHLPLSVFKDQDHLIIAPNPNFKPNVFLDKKPHDREMVRLLYSFNSLSPQEKQDELTNLRHLIPDYALRYKLPIIPEILRAEFAKHAAEKMEDFEQDFWDDREEFIKQILDLQEEFLNQKFIETAPKVLSEEEAKEKALQAAIKQATQALEKDFAKWYDNNIDEDTEALFFDNRIKFFQKILQMQWQFIHEKANHQTSLKQTPTPSKYSPKAIKAYLDQFVIGQENAKKGMSLVFSDHYKRISGQSTLEKANAICIGPSGSGKTYLIEMATKYLDIPYCIANAAAFTPTGYIGNETNQMFATLYANADNDREKAEQGVLVLDEVDKLGQGSWHDKEWRQGVQNELLKVIEKGFVSFDYGDRATGQKITLKTENMLFIILGHFEKLWHNNELKEPNNVLFGKVPNDRPQFTSEDLIACGMKREFLRRFSVRVVFDPVDVDMLTELLDRRLKPFEEEFQAYGSALEFSQNAKRTLVESALHEGIGMSGLDQKLHEILMPLRFDLEEYTGFKCIITQSTLRSGRVRKTEL